jgi:putative protein-disulfide isomerase
MRDKIIYIYDPLCGWCYAFSSVIQKLKDNYQEYFDFEIYSSGMLIGNNSFEINEVSEFISNTITGIEKHTKVIFGENFKKLLNTNYQYSSLKPSIALTVFKELKKNESINFASDIQKSFFYGGKDLNELNTYLELIEQYGISKSDFTEMFFNPVYEAKTYNTDFNILTKYKINNIPSIIRVKNDKRIVLSRGYQDYNKVSLNLNHLIQN